MFELLKGKQVKLCVLSSASKDAQPWSAVMAYAVEDGNTILLSTHATSRKWNNLKENPRVALVFGFGFDEPNIQCEGTAQLIEDGEALRACEGFFFTVNPHAAKFKSPDTVFVRVSPSYMRMTDFTALPPAVTEWRK